MRPLAAVFAALLCASPHAAASAGPAQTLAATGAAMAGAARALAATAPGPDDLQPLAAAIERHEWALEATRAAIFDAEARERALTLDLHRRRPEIARLLLALEQLAPPTATPQGPPGPTPLHPAGPLAAARAAAMLEFLEPALAAQARALGDQLAEIGRARELRAEGTDTLEAGLGALGVARNDLLAARAARTPAATDPAALAPPALFLDATGLSELADRLADPDDARSPVDATPIPLRWPVAGDPLRGFREPDAAGVRNPGLILRAPTLALVVAPVAGAVRYAGPFLDYGYVVVLQPRPGTLIVLAGLATLETRTGARIDAGDLLGLLGGRQLDAQEYLMLGRPETGETPSETLYIEVRQARRPVDPAAWLQEPNEQEGDR